MGYNTKNGIKMYLLLLFTSFFVPKDIMYYPYLPVMMVVVFYVGSWLFILKYIGGNYGQDSKTGDIDYLYYDLLRLIGLPIIFYIIIEKTGLPFWEEPVIEIFYLFWLTVVVIFKIINYKNKHSGIVRFVTIWLTPIINIVIINQFLTVWFIWTYLSFGYR